jgi:hypothetical protein
MTQYLNHRGPDRPVITPQTTARTWYSDEREFRQLCGDAQSQARGESAQEFAAGMVIKANQHGLDTYLSERQLGWLCLIADHDVPKRVKA